ncbi:ATP-binding cassette domain-containing protein [Paenibacillus sp. NEAU-GSW1]|uniref:ATP-binding cassette domain-containing protein n=1 Tax=Paenibacillus sp. NEAU-GSW1 TaxID=2682486 RepID=UPI0012E291E7|nr:ATP-binding cassette domain-containing protein [Paenibacillus sp. NEAU-GSW1]MUT66438.1 ATP-binding cassette domain-containing protein [Paenibacillus sp. NEAU-GSW1]
MQKLLFELKQVSVKPFDRLGSTDIEEQSTTYMLHNINLSIMQGEWVTLIGRNGSGKSTLAKLLAGFQTGIASGEMMLHHVIGGASGRETPIVMQQPEASMVGSTPMEDLIIMLEQHGIESSLIRSRAEHALQIVEMSDKAHQSVSTLSGGQKQRVAIAGCLAVDAPFLILDEPTAMLDPEGAAHILKLVRSLHSTGITVLWITQKLDELREVDRVIALNEGLLCFDGAAHQLYQRGKSGEASICELLGFEAPYVVQTVWELEKLGISLRTPSMPLSASGLVKAVLQ